ncbi:MAG TPA: sodium:solute symporter family protein [Thermoanaerobaculia bacterium]|nr:sodium:solute symporter family protein [Thermoanaerobaculia bacterium]
MEAWVVAVVVCGLYLAVSLVAGIVPGLRVSKSVSGYVAADRSMSTMVLYFVLGASIFSSFAFLGGPGWAYSRGVAALYIVGYGVLGMVPFYFIGPKARRIGERMGFVTQAELLSHRFRSRPLSVLLAVLSIAAFIPYLVLQMQGAGIILETLTGGRVSMAVGAGVTYGVVMVYVLTSGVLGVGWTNMLQGVFMMVVAWFLGLYLPWKLYGGVGEMFARLAAERPELLAAPGLGADGQPWSFAAFSSAIVVSAVGFTMWPHLFMKAFAAKSDRALRLTVVLYPTFQVFLIPILFIGFSGVLAYPGVEPADSIVPYLLTHLELSPLLVGLVCAGTLAASMSSGDSILHSAASIGIRDGLAALLPGRLDDRAERAGIRLLVVALSLVAFYFAVVSRVSLVDLLLGAYGGVAQIMPPVLAALYWRRATGAGAIAGLVGGLAVNVLFLVRPELKPIAGLHEGIYGLAVNVPLLVGVSLATRREPAELVDSFVEA